MPHPARHLPSLHTLLERRAIKGLGRGLRREVLVGLARELLDEERAVLHARKGFEERYGCPEPDRRLLLRHCERRLLKEVETLLRPKLRRVINATGVLLHTNLGRARLSRAATEELMRVAEHPCALEVDLDTGVRGKRHARISRLLHLLTGAEDALVVNNGAAALWLAVHVLGRRRRAVISRGEQVAIGGSFRMPELMRSTGARLVEVGTTNKTNLDDYARALGESDVIVKVHPSNYRIEGFCEEVPLADLAALCREHRASLVFDAGSGSLYNFGKLRLGGELPVNEAIAAGADLVTFSGDKLLGGPQAGLIIGRGRLVRRLGCDPMMRALRCDKLALAALESTLLAYLRTPGRARPDLPLFDLLAVGQSELRRRGRELQQRLQKKLPEGWTVTTERSTAAMGGGSFAEHPLPSQEIRLRGPEPAAAEELHLLLRRGEPAVLSRVGDGAVRFDLRSIALDELAMVEQRIEELLVSGERVEDSSRRAT